MKKSDIEYKLKVTNRIKSALEKCLEGKPNKLRPTKPSDIYEGNVIWIKLRRGYEPVIIESVNYPDDDFKAFNDLDGDRYGHDGAFVEDNT